MYYLKLLNTIWRNGLSIKKSIVISSSGHGGGSLPLQLQRFSSFKANNQKSAWQNARKLKNESTKYYLFAVAIVTFGLSFAAIPLYGAFCQVTGYGGTTNVDTVSEKLKALEKKRNRKITVKFNSDLASDMAWNFKPQQSELQVIPGETALAFYTATNPTDKPIIGVSTYNVIPYDVGPYFNKIQCFCFEEQMLNPHEEVDLPVFFYIDPEFADDPKMELIDEIVLSYTFFEARDCLKLPVPSFLKSK